MVERMSLAEAPLRIPLTLVDADAPAEVRRRLAALGLRRGAPVTLIQRTAGGGRLAVVAGSRIALGKSLLSQVHADVAGR